MTTTGPVVVETDALLRRRIGVEAVRDFHTRILPVISVMWLDAEVYEKALLPYLASGRTGPSLVDFSSFALMRTRGVTHALTLDRYFAEQGFDCLPNFRAE